MPDKLILSYKGKGRGADGYRYTSVRLRCEIVEAIDRLAGQVNRSRNEIIALMLEYCIKNAIVVVEERGLGAPFACEEGISPINRFKEKRR